MHSLRTLKALYITALFVIIMLTGLFIASFFFFERTAHETLYYAIEKDGHTIATSKIDRFRTEDRFIYRELVQAPFDPLFTSIKTKLVYDHAFTLDAFAEERLTRGEISVITRLENKDNLASYLSRYQSRIVAVDKIPTRKDIFVFREDLPLTYLPVIENYDFFKGRSQGFFACTFPSPFLPPMKRYVTLTSIRDEYLKIEGRRIKTEKLLLKVKDFVRGSVWVAKSDRKVIMIELPRRGILIRRTFAPQDLAAPDVPEPAATVSREVSFRSGDISLVGTLTAPAKEGRYPAVLLLPGKGPYPRDYMGFFAAAADYFSHNGLTTLRFDKRGTGTSEGEAAWPLLSKRVEDIASAIAFLAKQPEADPHRIALAVHGDGALEAALAAAGSVARGIVFMAPQPYELTDYDRTPDLISAASTRNRWPREFGPLVARAARETKDRALQSKFNWTYILRKRCFLGSLKERIPMNPIEKIAGIASPVLIVQGADDRELIIEAAPAMEQALEAAGNTDVSLVYFDGLGHFFGAPIIDGTHRIRYAPQEQVLDTIRAWVNTHLPPLPQKEPERAASQPEGAPNEAVAGQAPQA